jgi:hypothetical protein
MTLFRLCIVDEGACMEPRASVGCAEAQDAGWCLHAADLASVSASITSQRGLDVTVGMQGDE